MILVPRWEEAQDDSALEILVGALLTTMGCLDPSDDVRLHTKEVQEVVAAAAADAAAERAAMAACNSEEIELPDDDAENDADRAYASMQGLPLTEVATTEQHQPVGLVLV